MSDKRDDENRPDIDGLINEVNEQATPDDIPPAPKPMTTIVNIHTRPGTPYTEVVAHLRQLADHIERSNRPQPWLIKWLERIWHRIPPRTDR